MTDFLLCIGRWALYLIAIVCVAFLISLFI
jgi:hypothetical protein